MFKKRRYPGYLRPLRERVIPFVLMLGGLFLVIAFTPVWMWVFILGVVLIYIGFYIMKKWR